MEYNIGLFLVQYNLAVVCSPEQIVVNHLEEFQAVRTHTLILVHDHDGIKECVDCRCKDRKAHV